jgi:hypothetical protein
MDNLNGGARRVVQDNWQKRKLYDQSNLGKQFSLYGTPRTYNEVIQDDGIVRQGVTRKKRIVDTLDGTPTKGTLVIACRGTKDLEDLSTDMQFGNILFKTGESLDSMPYYQAIRAHIVKILNTEFTRTGSSAYNYKQFWDVFTTGHSLGGACAEQLIVDGIAKGGLSISAPRTLVTERTRPAYSVISNADLVIARTNLAPDSYYDFANPEYTRYKTGKDGSKVETAFHGHDMASIGVLQSADGGPRWNESKFYDTEVVEGEEESLNPFIGQTTEKTPYSIPKPTTEGVVEEPPYEDVDPMDLRPNEPTILDKVKNAIQVPINTVVDKGKAAVEAIKQRVLPGKKGSGPAPKAEYMRRMARNVYKPFIQSIEDLALTGLEIPEFRFEKSGWGKGIGVQFYIISTPANYIDFYNMPVYNLVKANLLRMSQGQDPAKVQEAKDNLETKAQI